MVESLNQIHRRRKPALQSPIRSFKGVVRVIDAGADEVYCGVRMPGVEDFVLYRGSNTELSSYNELAQVVKYAHDHGVSVAVTINNPFMVEKLEEKMKKHVRLCVDQQVDAFIIGDVGVLSLISTMDLDTKLWASTYFVSMNYQAVNFLGELGFNRVILERQLSISEIAEIVQHSKIEVEIIIHGGGCSNINGKCYLFHFNYPALTKARNRLKGLHSPCMLPFEIYNVNDKKAMIDNVPIMDSFTGCSLCRLPELIHTGVAAFKIVGRGEWIAYQENTTKLYRECIDLIVNGQTKVFWERVKSLKTTFMASPPSLLTLQDYYCEQKRCYYSSFAHTPYRIPRSWRGWTKHQFCNMAVVE